MSKEIVTAGLHLLKELGPALVPKALELFGVQADTAALETTIRVSQAALSLAQDIVQSGGGEADIEKLRASIRSDWQAELGRKFAP